MRECLLARRQAYTYRRMHVDTYRLTHALILSAARAVALEVAQFAFLTALVFR